MIKRFWNLIVYSLSGGINAQEEPRILKINEAINSIE